jgi:hypothetical protein
MSKVVPELIDYAFPDATTFVDFGGGYGLFARLMRDAGYEFYHLDCGPRSG